MKNMSVFLDLFIHLDTIRIVICGGVNANQPRTEERAKAMQDYQLSASDTQPRDDVAAMEWTSV